MTNNSQTQSEPIDAPTDEDDALRESREILESRADEVLRLRALSFSYAEIARRLECSEEQAYLALAHACLDKHRESPREMQLLESDRLSQWRARLVRCVVRAESEGTLGFSELNAAIRTDLALGREQGRLHGLPPSGAARDWWSFEARLQEEIDEIRRAEEAAMTPEDIRFFD